MHPQHTDKLIIPILFHHNSKNELMINKNLFFEMIMLTHDIKKLWFAFNLSKMSVWQNSIIDLVRKCGSQQIYASENT